MYFWETPEPKGIYEWSLLNDHGREYIEEIIEEWNTLIQLHHKEEIYHKFLAENAGLFLNDFHQKFICLSKIRLGADYIIDFAVATEGYSNGLTWELIEIESPSSPPFNKEGIPSSRLSRAIQQIQDWKRWMIDNRRETNKIFPARGVRTTRKANFNFTIIIGKRENSERWLDKRNQYSENIGIDIRSFDYLTSVLAEKYFVNKTFLGSSEEKDMGDWERNQLVNPFSSAFSDKAWRNFLGKQKTGAHFVSSTARELLEHRPYNKDRVKYFKMNIS